MPRLLGVPNAAHPACTCIHMSARPECIDRSTAPTASNRPPPPPPGCQCRATRAYHLRYLKPHLHGGNAVVPTWAGTRFTRSVIEHLPATWRPANLSFVMYMPKRRPWHPLQPWDRSYRSSFDSTSFLFSPLSPALRFPVYKSDVSTRLSVQHRFLKSLATRPAC
ncbi:hypothetical protein BDV26DRAFT_70324 [Aspergillus bertholletiae]|uniref:Uncharacterized protein n=1 Tax=Aspergillus bertholletiae TaxID=1226010 RepID=A0A5N7AWB6_9EURO|nr:hypothetical protein BDV26DRAFT_70324 [Aspergillus bertholletiae]